MNDKYIELAKRLKALAAQGVGGERYTAQLHLEKIMKKHGITMADLEDEDRSWEEFTVKPEQLQLFHQVAWSVVGDAAKRMSQYRNRRRKNIFLLEVTTVEKVEIQARFDFYWRLYQEEADIFYNAFVQKNRIFREEEMVGPKDLDLEEIAKMERIMEMTGSIRAGTYRKQLAGSNE